MTECKTESQIVYYVRQNKQERPPAGYEGFVIREINRKTNKLVKKHFIAAESEFAAEKIVEGVYQTPGREFSLIREVKTGRPIRG